MSDYLDEEMGVEIVARPRRRSQPTAHSPSESPLFEPQSPNPATRNPPFVSNRTFDRAQAILLSVRRLKEELHAADEPQRAYGLHSLLLQSTRDHDVATLLSAQASSQATNDQLLDIDNRVDEAVAGLEKLGERSVPAAFLPTGNAAANALTFFRAPHQLNAQRGVTPATLLENLLLVSDMQDVLMCQAVCKTWRDAINNSKDIQEKLFFAGKVTNTYWLINSTAKTIRTLHGVAEVSTLGPASMSEDPKIGMRVPMVLNPCLRIVQAARDNPLYNHCFFQDVPSADEHPIVLMGTPLDATRHMSCMRMFIT